MSTADTSAPVDGVTDMFVKMATSRDIACPEVVFECPASRPFAPIDQSQILTNKHAGVADENKKQLFAKASNKPPWPELKKLTAPKRSYAR